MAAHALIRVTDDATVVVSSARSFAGLSPSWRAAQMSQNSLEDRVSLLENELRGLPARVGAVETRLDSFEAQFVQFRAEVRAEFSAVRSELRAEMRTLHNEEMAQARALHEDLVARIKLLDRG